MRRKPKGHQLKNQIGKPGTKKNAWACLDVKTSRVFPEASALQGSRPGWPERLEPFRPTKELRRVAEAVGDGGDPAGPKIKISRS